ncbi:MAG: carbamoyltransferase HypF [Bacteroidota bacterium]
MRQQQPSSYCLHVRGTVQGVGFRPYVLRLARKHLLNGTVENRNDGVWINLQSTRDQLHRFIRDLRQDAPPAATIDSVETIQDNSMPRFQGFHIIDSHNHSDDITGISPDIAVCKECLEDFESQPLRRHYPFINCTNCGPRFSLVEELPYDRQCTSMAVFTMCPDCLGEYTNPTDRRFHAQPVACNHCGPVHYTNRNQPGSENWPAVLQNLITCLKTGQTAAVKGIGGYHLMCNAIDSSAVELLRKRKHRDGKPFAVMFPDIETVRQYCECSVTEEDQLLSWRRPIVLLKEIRAINPLINSNLGSLGVLLPYTPLHYQLFREGAFTALVCTSGNNSDNPIETGPEGSEKSLAGIADLFVHHNRRIINRTDDSVIRLTGSDPIILRRSRGYAPAPVTLAFSVEGILAAGAEQKNTFCIGRKNEAILSQHIGDLTNPETLFFYEEAIHRFRKMFRFNPVVAVTDLHPDYLSTQYADSLGIPVIRIQHHHAHIASCLAEHRINGPVIGIAFDGTGLGTDQSIWGGEILIASLSEFTRYMHFESISLPGGDTAAREPWKSALAYLYACYGNTIPFESFPALKSIPDEDKRQFLALIRSGAGCHNTSSAGRLFDAVAALTGCCLVNTFEAEAPIRFEMMADKEDTREYSLLVGTTVSFVPTIDDIRSDLEAKVPVTVISSRFHRTVARAILEISEKIRRENGLNQVALTGGTFQNALLTGITRKLLENHNFTVFTNRLIPPNDGGISLGQLAIAAHLLKK